MDDDDLFAVFDSESSKSQQVVIPQEEDDAKPKLDPNAVVSEICGSIKRPSDNTENSEEVGSKKGSVKKLSFSTLGGFSRGHFPLVIFMLQMA